MARRARVLFFCNLAILYKFFDLYYNVKLTTLKTKPLITLKPHSSISQVGLISYKRNINKKTHKFVTTFNRKFQSCCRSKGNTKSTRGINFLNIFFRIN